jgi:hypothetical protein
MITIAVTGPIGHGKTTFMDAFCGLDSNSIKLESGELIANIVERWHKYTYKVPRYDDYNHINDWLKLLIKAIDDETGLKLKFDQIKIDVSDVKNRPEQYSKLFDYLKAVDEHPGLIDNKITADNKPYYRPILQWLGGYLVYKFGAGVWTDQLAKMALQARADDKNLCSIGALRYPSDLKSYESLEPVVVSIARPSIAEEKDKNDPTERERHKIPIDVKIINDGSIEDLSLAAQKLLLDIKSGKMKAQYSSQSLAS